MPEAEAAISSSRMARMARPYLERINRNICVMHTMVTRMATHKKVTLALVPKPRPFLYSEAEAEPRLRPSCPQKGRLLMMLTMIMPKPRVMMAR